jgi:hypothetical protein
LGSESEYTSIDSHPRNGRPRIVRLRESAVGPDETNIPTVGTNLNRMRLKSGIKSDGHQNGRANTIGRRGRRAADLLQPSYLYSNWALISRRCLTIWRID